MKKTNKLILVLLCVSQNSFADLTGAGDAAIVSQLVVQTGKIVEQIQQAKEALDISNYMQNIEQLRQIKTLSNTGAQFGQLFNNINTGLDDVNNWESDPFGLKSVNSEIETLEHEIEAAKNKGDLEKSKRYARTLKNLKNIKFLGEANEQAQKAVSTGNNELDLTRVTAESTVVMSALLQSKEQREIEAQYQREKQAEIAEDFLTNGLTYSPRKK